MEAFRAKGLGQGIGEILIFLGLVLAIYKSYIIVT